MTAVAPVPSPNHAQPHPRNVLIERIATGAVGALVLALQGINIGETGSNAELIRRVEDALRQQTQVVKGFEAEASRIDRALENQDKMIERLDRTLELLDKEQTKH
jgi:hypothetical protein